jgi:hypothetical protein
MNLQEVTYYLLYVTTVKSAEKALVKLTLKVFIHSLKLKMQLLIHCSATLKTSSLTTVVLESKNLVMHLKVENAEVAVAVAKEEATAAAVNAEVMVAAKEKAMAAEAATEEVLAEAEDVKAEALAADSEISLVNHVKVEAEKEDADLNLYKQIRKARINYPGLFLLRVNYP